MSLGATLVVIGAAAVIAAAWALVLFAKSRLPKKPDGTTNVGGKLIP